jgi:hypothetical protein
MSILQRAVTRQRRLVTTVNRLEMKLAFNPRAQPASLARLLTLWLDLWVTSRMVNLLTSRHPR